MDVLKKLILLSLFPALLFAQTTGGGTAGTPGSGTVTSVTTANTRLSVANGTSTPVLTIPDAFEAIVSDSGGQVFNVKAYGAVGDGTTNDATAIQAAITAAGNISGGIVFFPPSANPWKINSKLTITKPVSLIGQGASGGSFYLASAPEPTKIVWGGGADTMLVCDFAGGVRIANMRFNGKKVATIGIVWRAVYMSQMQNVEVDSLTSIGIMLNTCKTGGTNTQGNLIENITTGNVPIAMRLAGKDTNSTALVATGNVCHNLFQRLSLAFDSVGLYLRYCDNNTFTSVFAYRSTVGTGHYGVVFDTLASSNDINHLEPNGGVLVNTPYYTGGDNTVRDYDVSNGEALPTINTGGHLTFSTLGLDARGIFFAGSVGARMATATTMDSSFYSPEGAHFRGLKLDNTLPISNLDTTTLATRNYVNINTTNKATTATTITVAGTASQITSSAGAQDLSANRTWTLSFPTPVKLGSAGTPAITTSRILEVWGANLTDNNPGSFNIYSTDALAADKGGSISFGGPNATANYFTYGKIEGRSTSGSAYAGYLSFLTTTSGGTVAERMRIDSIGTVKIWAGSGTTASGTNSGLEVWKASNADNAVGNINVYSTDALAADKGGSIAFGGANATANVGDYAKIAGHSTTGSAYAGYLQLLTSTSGGTMTERARLDSAGDLGIGTTAPTTMFSVAEKFNVNSSGVPTKWNNTTVPTGEGYIYAVLADTVKSGANTATIGSTSLNNTSTNGLYKIEVYVYPTTAGTSGTVTATVGWNDGTAETAVTAAHTFGALGTPVTSTTLCRVTNSTAITWQTTVTANIGGVYEIDVTATRIF